MLNNKIVWCGIYLSVLVWSVINPADMFTWWLEAAPALVAIPLLFFTHKRFPLTSLVYFLVLVHCCVLFVGAHYTYAEVPLFDTIANWMGSERNNYDKLGHFAQGFIPAMLAREIMLRNKAVKPGTWCAFIVTCFVLAFSAFYELIEWWVAVATGEGAEAFLGTQGYVWDTQSDMLMALIGAIVALLLLSRVQDKQIAELKLTS
ncbi:membrane protein [Shewanella morhuae]|nr:membrane protein [Shewanella morhuae]